MFEELLARFQLDKDKLSSDEIRTLDTWAKSLSVQKLTLAEVGEYVSQMVESVERELTGYGVPETLVGYLFRRSRRRHLEARLHNLLMLRDFLTRPDRAVKFVEKRMQALKEQLI